MWTEIAGPFQRACLLPGFSTGIAPTLRDAWARSQRTAREILAHLESHMPPGVSVIACCGSISRMEQLRQSDADLIVLLDDAMIDDADRAAAFRAVWTALEPLGILPPKSDGIYGRTTTAAQLLNPGSLGQIDEDLHIFGHRFQLLAEAQPLYGRRAHADLLARIVARYAAGDAASGPEEPWAYLLNDTIRYFRSLSVRYQWEGRDRRAFWRLRNLKKHFSRFVIFAGLLVLLGESSTDPGDQHEWLRGRLAFTPLERLGHVYELHGAAERLQAVIGMYDAHLELLADEQFRVALDAPDAPPGYDDLLHTARVLHDDVLQFVLDRRGTWADEFFRSLLY